MSVVPPGLSRLGVGKVLAGDTARPAGTNWPKGHSTMGDISSGIKDKKRRRKVLHSVLQCLCSQAITSMLKPCFPGSDWAFQWEVQNKISLFFYFVYAHTNFSSSKLLYLNLQVVLSYFISHVPLGRKGMEWLGGHLAPSQGPPTTSMMDIFSNMTPSEHDPVLLFGLF